MMPGAFKRRSAPGQKRNGPRGRGGVSDVRLAYLINAHKNFEQLERLIEKLSLDEAGFFVHIDKKVDGRIFSALAGRLSKHNVEFINHRVAVSWGGFSQVEATLNGLAAVLQCSIRYDYINFMSGQDYPLKRNAAILEFLKNNNGKEFIDYAELTPTGWAAAMSRFNKYHLPELIRNKNVRRFCEYILNKALPKRKFPEGYIPYGGSSWWTISYDCADYIFAFTKKNQGFVKFFKLTHAPDEMFFQTIVMNSPYKQKAYKDNLRYIDWSERQRNPRILTRDDFPKLLAADKLFARKFDTCVDTQVLDLIDNYTQ
jgi:hypothetical protein